MKQAKTVKFDKDNDPKILQIVNELAALTSRRPTDAARQFILACGPAYIVELKKQKNPSVSVAD